MEIRQNVPFGTILALVEMGHKFLPVLSFMKWVSMAGQLHLSIRSQNLDKGI